MAFDAKIRLSSDTSRVDAGIAGVQRRIAGLGKSLAGTIGGLFAVSTITTLISSMAQYADEIQNAADRLGLAAEQVQILKTTARQAGYEFSSWEKILGRMNLNRSLALRGATTGDKKIMAAAAGLNLTEEDLTNSNKSGKFGFLQKALRGTVGLTDDKATEYLNTLFGDKNAGKIMLPQREAILSGKFNPVSGDVIAQMDALGDAFEDLREEATQGLLPAFVDVVNWVSRTIKGTTGLVGEHATATAAYKYASRATGNPANTAESALFATEYMLAMRGARTGATAVAMSEIKGNGQYAFAQREKRVKEIVARVENDFLQGRLGPEGTTRFLERMQSYEKTLEDKALDREEARKNRARARAEKAAGEIIGPADALPTTPTTPKKPTKPSEKFEGMDYTPSGVTYGNLLGINSQLRLASLAEQTNAYLAEMVEYSRAMKDYLEQMANKKNTGGEEDNDPPED